MTPPKSQQTEKIELDDDGNPVAATPAPALTPSSAPSPAPPQSSGNTVQLDDDGNLVETFSDRLRVATNANLPPPPPPSPPTGYAPNGSTSTYDPQAGSFSHVLSTLFDPIGNLAMGAAKGAESTIVNLGSLAHHIPGMSIIAPDRTGAFDSAHQDSDVADALATHGGMQGTGKFLEQVGEFFIPGGIASRGAKATTAALNAGKWMQLAIRAGIEGLSAAGVTAAQGGNPVEAGAGTALISGVLGAPGAILGKTNGVLVNGAEQLLRDTGVEVPLTVAQQTQNVIRSTFERLVRRTAMGGAKLAKFDLEQNAALRSAGEKLVDSLGSAPGEGALAPHEAGRYIQRGIEQMREVAQKEYGAVVDGISSEAGGTKISRERLLTLAAATKDVAAPLKEALKAMPHLGNVDKVRTAIALLGDFMRPVQKTIINSGGGAQEIEVVKRVTFDQARYLRSLLYNLTNKGEITMGEGAIKQFNKALHSAMTGALEDAGREDLAQTFEAASGRFRTARKLFEEGIDRGIVNSNKPELLVDRLLSKGGESDMTFIRQALHSTDTRPVRQALLDRLLQTNTSDDVLLGARLRKVTESIGRGTMNAIFDDAGHLRAIENFVDLADKLAIGKNAGKLTSQMAVPISDQIAAKLVISDAGAGRLGKFVVAQIVSSQLAEMLSNPKVTYTLTKALTANPATAEGRQVMAKLTGYLLSTVSHPQPQQNSTVYPPAKEAGIQQVMKDHHMTRDAAIKALTERGHL